MIVAIVPILAVASVAAWFFSTDARAAGTKPAAKAQANGFSGDPNRPRRHFRVRNPAHLTSQQAAQIYRRLHDVMASGYRLSRDPSAASYQGWPRYNTAPYVSATHGQRYVNNYANPAAAAYGKFEAAGRLPVGAIIAKDSFTVAKDGVVAPGPLFLMEKMPAGFSYVSGDWRYTMIMPDGSLFGRTKGENAERVEFCIACHLAREKTDHLYFIPKAWRRN